MSTMYTMYFKLKICYGLGVRKFVKGKGLAKTLRLVTRGRREAKKKKT